MAVKTYSYATQKNVYCSKHTQVREMASIRGGKLYSDKVLVDDTLMNMIEKLFSKLQCSKYIISSGYRTPEHDRAVGGNGKGQHTLGKAVDACFYWKDDSIIPAPIVCCVAQDIGFKGIANISKNYRYVHLDMRTSGTYLGDEIKSTSTVTNNFRKYFNVTDADIIKYTGEKPKKSVTEIAKEVIAGKWGNGQERKEKLTQAGYDYNAVQKEVNKLATKTTAPATIKVGSTVKVKSGAKTYTGGKLASFVYSRKHKVKEIKGDRVVITYLGIVVAAVKLSDLTLVS